jgi:nucleotidyltransferase/DNA polymerase involved in DNA repair
MSRTILHIDMDAFFAAVEQSDHPEWRGKPVVVGSDPKGGKGRGVVSTCSYEARRFGIRSAMPISKAWQLNPDAIYVQPRGRRYAGISRQVMAILSAYSPDLEQLSIDEAFLDITSTQKLFGGAEALALRIKADILEQTNLTCSIGIAPNKFVAKIASDLRKPDGLVIVPEGSVEPFLNPLEIARLWGCGPKTVPVLQGMGIFTIGDLAARSQKELIDRFGQTGMHFWRLARGLDERPVSDGHTAKSMSRETTFEIDCGDEEEMRTTLFTLCDDLSYDMRRHGVRGRTVTLKIRLADFSTFTRSHSLECATDASAELYRQVKELFDRFKRGGERVRLLGVAVSQLQQEEGQMDLFGREGVRKDKVDSIMDDVRKKFGTGSISRASLLQNRRDSQWIRD